MVGMEFGCKILMLLSIFVVGKADVYIVRVEGEPVVSYEGGVDGFEATYVESDEKIDVTRYSQNCCLFCQFQENQLRSLNSYAPVTIWHSIHDYGSWLLKCIFPYSCVILTVLTFLGLLDSTTFSLRYLKTLS